MNDEEYEYDPSRAEVGPHAEPRYEPLDLKFRYGMEKEAIAEGDMARPHGDDVSVAPGDADLEDLNEVYRGSDETDTNVRGAPEGPDNPGKPDPKALIEGRVKKLMQKDIVGQEGEIVRKQEEAQDAAHEEFKTVPSDPSVNREFMEEKSEGGPSMDNNMIYGRGNYTDKMASIQLLSNDEANPIKIMLTLDKYWDKDWLDWDAGTIHHTAEQEGVDISRTNMGKILALKVLRKTDKFWNDPVVFEKVCVAFSSRMVDWSILQEIPTHHIASTVGLIEKYIKESEWDPAVSSYVAASAIRDGYILLPAILSFANYEFSNELVTNIGDDALEKQEKLMKALKEEDKEILSTEGAVQYMRLLKCQYMVQDRIDGAKA